MVSAQLVPRLLGARLVAPTAPMLLPTLSRAAVARVGLQARSATFAAAKAPMVSRPPLGLMRSYDTFRPSLAPTLTLAAVKQLAARRFQQSRHQSTAAITPSDLSSSSTTFTAAPSSTPLVSRPIVALHLYALAFLVYAIVIVGGLTRLTESGLSITEWNPGFKGLHLPTTLPEWESEWDKYKQTPEFHLLNSRMSLDDFKRIYMWEWGHRVLGRVIGVAFTLPAAYFVFSKKVAGSTRWKLAGIALGIGFQGFLGWFMVKSGLSVPKGSEGRAKTVEIGDEGGRSVPTSSAQTLVATAEWTPRVSHFRLALHMGTAFLVYLAMLHTGLAVQRDYKAASLTGSPSGVPLRSTSTLSQLANTLHHPLLRSHSRWVKVVAGLVFTTAMSGALVAGLDAGLVYNEFPTMGEGRLAPPIDELIDDRFAQRQDGSDKLWRNLTQNPVTVQLIHRTLAITTACTVLGLAWRTHRLGRIYSAAVRAGTSGGKMMLPSLPPRVTLLAKASVAVVAAQVTLGITTLIYMVPIPLASAHQAGAMALLSVLVAMVSALRPIPASVLAKGLGRNSGLLSRVLSSSGPGKVPTKRVGI